MQSLSAQFARFAAGGLLGTACHYATLVILVELAGVPAVPATLAGYVLGALTNYLIARRFVFATTRPHRAALPRFMVVAASGAAINTVIVALLIATGLHYLPSQLVATLIVLGWNFLVNKYWTFST